MAVARLERTLYRSGSVSIVDVLAYGAEEIRVGAASLAFVRSGYFTKRGQSASIVDVNYAVLGGADECLLGGPCPHICACTIVTYEGPDRPVSAPGCPPASSRAFLAHTRLLSDACLRRGNPAPDVLRLFCEVRGDANMPCAYDHPRIVTEIRRLMNDQPFKRLSLETIGHELYMSPFSVSRLFHRETGMRLRDYALRLRLRKALSLLVHSRKNLTSVAIDMGFYDEPHFSKAFRGEFGVSPQSVRRYCTKSDFS